MAMFVWELASYLYARSHVLSSCYLSHVGVALALCISQELRDSQSDGQSFHHWDWNARDWFPVRD